MKKRTSYFARIVALLALLAAIAAVVLIAQAALKNDDDSGKGKNTPTKQTEKKKPKTKAKTYEVQPGDTLTKISHQTGVPVSELIGLNPEVDPQILIAGETLKLR